MIMHWYFWRQPSIISFLSGKLITKETFVNFLTDLSSAVQQQNCDSSRSKSESRHLFKTNYDFEMFIESWIFWVSCKVKWSQKGFTLTLQESQSIHDSMNRPKIEFIAKIYILL